MIQMIEVALLRHELLERAVFGEGAVAQDKDFVVGAQDRGV